MRTGLLVLALAVGSVVGAGELRAQYFRFEGMSDRQIELEVEPILEFFTTLVGSGMYHTADLHSFAGVDLGVGSAIANVPDDLKSLPAFSEESLVGLPYLFASVGLIAHIELFGRFLYFPLGSGTEPGALPPRAFDSRGNVSMVSAGVRYGLVQMVGLPKVMVSVAYSRLDVPTEFDFGDVSNWSLNLAASHSFLILTLYAGVGLDHARFRLDEPFLDGARFSTTEPHATVGARFTILPLVFVHGAYNFSDFPGFNLGLGVSFR